MTNNAEALTRLDARQVDDVAGGVPDTKGPVKVTVSDPQSGAVLEERILDNDYALICAGRRYVKNIQVMGWRNPTHMIAVAWSKE